MRENLLMDINKVHINIMVTVSVRVSVMVRVSLVWLVSGNSLVALCIAIWWWRDTPTEVLSIIDPNPDLVNEIYQTVGVHVRKSDV